MMGAFLEKKVDFVMRVPSCKFKEFEEFMQSTELDSLCYINREKKGWCGYVRVVRYTIEDNDYVLVTSLLDSSSFTRESLKELYHQRWGIEEFFKTLKQDFQFEFFHSKTKNGIMQELYTSLFLCSISRWFEVHTKMPSPKRTKPNTLTKNSTSSEKTTRKYNRRHTISTVVLLLPELLSGNVHFSLIDCLQRYIKRGIYKAYGGRSFPRVSYKPSAKWRKTRRSAKY